MVTTQYRRIVFTLNNPVDWLDLSNSTIRYGIYQYEKGESGTPHYQGYLEFNKRLSLKGIKNLLGSNTMHIEGAFGSQSDCINYCSKTDTRISGPFEYGHRSTQSETQSNIPYIQSKRTISELYNDPQIESLMMKCPRWAESVFHSKPLEEVWYYTLKQWQIQLLERLATEPDDRTIIWIIDKDGGNGKSWISNLIERNFGGKELQCGHKEIGYYYEYEWIALFDIPRNQSDEYIQYEVMEKLKDGKIFNMKYHSHMKRFKSPHVVVLANRAPDICKFSLDRWEVYSINSGQLVYYNYNKCK